MIVRVTLRFSFDLVALDVAGVVLVIAKKDHLHVIPDRERPSSRPPVAPVKAPVTAQTKIERNRTLTPINSATIGRSDKARRCKPVRVRLRK